MLPAETCLRSALFFFFFIGTGTPEIYTLSLHDALPIWRRSTGRSPTFSCSISACPTWTAWRSAGDSAAPAMRSEEHTSELQSRGHLVCRLLLEKKKY